SASRALRNQSLGPHRRLQSGCPQAGAEPAPRLRVVPAAADADGSLRTGASPGPLACATIFPYVCVIPPMQADAQRDPVRDLRIGAGVRFRALVALLSRRPAIPSLSRRAAF